MVGSISGRGRGEADRTGRSASKADHAIIADASESARKNQAPGAIAMASLLEAGLLQGSNALLTRCVRSWLCRHCPHLRHPH
jgi:hypothetical protein